MGRKQVLVTGAGQGLGQAVVDSLVARDWDVWATDVKEIDPATCKAQHIGVLDVCDAQAISKFIGAVPGGLDGLVNNAAISPLKKWDELDLETWNKTLQVNLTGPFLCSQAAGRSMRDHGRGGAIVNLGSVTFFQGNPLGLHYTASKGGIVALTRSLAVALGQHRIRVNCVSPGLMKTELVMSLVEKGIMPGDRLLGENDPLRLLPGHTEPPSVADVIAYLLSDDARVLTGQVIVASGGTFLY